MGLGRDGFGYDYGDIYEYDPSSDTWTGAVTIPDKMESAICMVINDKAYIGMGLNIRTIVPHFYEYNPSTNALTRKADFP